MTNNNTMIDIFKNKLDDELGISKYQQGLKKKIGMAKGVSLTNDADTYIKGITPGIIQKGAEFLKQLRDSGIPMSKAKLEAEKYTKSLRDAVYREAELKYPGYEEAADIELRKKAGLSGIIKDKPISKGKSSPEKSTKKTSKKKATKKTTKKETKKK